MFVFFLLNLVCNSVKASTQDEVLRVVDNLKILDERIHKTLKELPKYEGEYVVKDLKDYNTGLSKLLKLLTDDRNATLEVEKAVKLMEEGAPVYFEANIDPDKAKLNWGWLNKGLDEIHQLRAESIKIWSSINRHSRLIELQFYSFPEGMNYTGYNGSNIPPLREKE